MRWLAIANPGAGWRGAAEVCAQDLLRQGLVARVAVSRFPGDAARIAREATSVDGLVAVGGDGTVLEVLAGLDTGRHALAVAPVGHGNCLARDLGMGTIAAARAALRGGNWRTIDLLRVTLQQANRAERSILAASTLAVGYVADVVATGRQRLPWMGRAAYGVASALTLPQPLNVAVVLDGTPAHLPARTGVVVNNTVHLANFRAFPQARLDDGRLDIMELGTHWLGQQAHNLSVLLGSERIGPARRAQAARVDFSFAAPRTLMLDGELYTDIVRASVACLPRACRCAAAL